MMRNPNFKNLNHFRFELFSLQSETKLSKIGLDETAIKELTSSTEGINILRMRNCKNLVYHLGREPFPHMLVKIVHEKFVRFHKFFLQVHNG